MTLDYYDKILGGITISLLAGISVGFLTKIPMYYGLGLGALISIALMYDGMFRNGPLG